MIVLKPEEMRKVDQLAIEAGFPDILLMETAGRGVALKVVALMKKKLGNKILIIAGKGNNGGDGLVASRYLHDFGLNVQVLLLTGEENLTGSTLINYKLCQLKGIILHSSKGYDFDLVKELINWSDLIIDAMLGTGINGPVREPVTDIIDLVNNSDRTVLAVDIPSGISGASGNILGKAVQADYTVTMAYPKLGLLVYPGRTYSGEIEIIDLGVPESYALRIKPQYYMLTTEEAKAMLPKRPVTGHKGSFGKVSIIGGSPGMAGAPYLTGMAALKTGAGLVKIAVSRKVQPVIASYTPELITCALKELSINDNLKSPEKLELDGIKDIMEHSNVLAVGPGLGQSAIVSNIIEKVLREFKGPLVLDADGLNVVKDPNVFKERKEPLIVTPHPGEMAHLMKKTVAEIEGNRIGIAIEFSTEYRIYLVLKGSSTIIALPDGRLYINLTGNDGMATAGSGDVLTGIIAGLLAQGLKAEQAVILGPYLHGLAGDLAQKERSSYSLTAGDLIAFLEAAFNNLLKRDKYSH